MLLSKFDVIGGGFLGIANFVGKSCIDYLDSLCEHENWLVDAFIRDVLKHTFPYLQDIILLQFLAFTEPDLFMDATVEKCDACIGTVTDHEPRLYLAAIRLVTELDQDDLDDATVIML